MCSNFRQKFLQFIATSLINICSFFPLISGEFSGLDQLSQWLVPIYLLDDSQSEIGNLNELEEEESAVAAAAAAAKFSCAGSDICESPWMETTFQNKEVYYIS